MSNRDLRKRRGHALLGIVVLSLILLASFVAWKQPGPKRDWTCETAGVPLSECMDTQYR